METTLFNAVFADAATRAVLVERGLVPADASRYDLHETTMGTQLYQLYDGTLKVHGTKKLLWHRRPIDERKIQVLGEAERLFPFAPGGTSTEKKPRRPKRRKRRRSPETKPRAAPHAASRSPRCLWRRLWCIGAAEDFCRRYRDSSSLVIVILFAGPALNW